MKIRKYQEMERLVSEAEGGTVLVAAGPDLYQSNRLREILVRRFRNDLGYDVMRYDGSELARGDLKRMLMESSLFASGSLLVLSDSHRLGKASCAELVESIETGLRSSALFLSSDHLPRESAVLRKLEKLVPYYICYEPFERDMAGWTSRLAGEEGIRLRRDGSGLLSQYAGRSLQRLSGAISKLALYHGPGSEIDAEGVREVLSGKGGIDVFQLGDMIFEDRRGEALDSAVNLLGRGEEPVAMIGYLYGLWQKVVVAAEILGKGGDRKAVTSATGARYPLLDKLLRFAGKYGGADVVGAAEAFAEADYGIKTGSDGMVVLAGLIFTLTSGSE